MCLINWVGKIKKMKIDELYFMIFFFKKICDLISDVICVKYVYYLCLLFLF